MTDEQIALEHSLTHEDGVCSVNVFAALAAARAEQHAECVRLLREQWLYGEAEVNEHALYFADWLESKKPEASK